jgi:hypothetical protein
MKIDQRFLIPLPHWCGQDFTWSDRFQHFQLTLRVRLTYRPDDEGSTTSEKSVYFHQTTLRYIPESCYLHTRRRENLKSKIGENL